MTGYHTQAMPTGNEDSLDRVSETYMPQIEASIVIIIITSVKILIGYTQHVSSACTHLCNRIGNYYEK